MRYESEEDTLNYLLRSARRLQASGAKGFALVNAGGVPVHFCWVAPFEGFRIAELNQVLKEPTPRSVLLFDCWTPSAERGHGYYGLCLWLVASRALEAGQRPWIFSAAANVKSVRSIERAGFLPRFSLVRKKTLLFDRISTLEFQGYPQPIMNLHPAA